jgi:uncharacterized membrane protein YfcA
MGLSQPFIDFLHQVIAPLCIGLVLSLFKLLAERKDLTFDEANSVALDLVAASIGALSVFYYRGRSHETVLLAVAGDLVCIGLLIIIRTKRADKDAKLKAGGNAIPPVHWFTGSCEILIGFFAAYWAIKAP